MVCTVKKALEHFPNIFEVIPYQHSAWIGVGKTVKLFWNFKKIRLKKKNSVFKLFIVFFNKQVIVYC